MLISKKPSVPSSRGSLLWAKWTRLWDKILISLRICTQKIYVLYRLETNSLLLPGPVRWGRSAINPLFLNLYISKPIRPFHGTWPHRGWHRDQGSPVDDLLFLSPTKDRLQPHRNLLQKFYETWALTVSTTTRKILIFQEQSRVQVSIWTPLQHNTHKKWHIPWPQPHIYSKL